MIGQVFPNETGKESGLDKAVHRSNIRQCRTRSISKTATVPHSIGIGFDEGLQIVLHKLPYQVN